MLKPLLGLSILCSFLATSTGQAFAQEDVFCDLDGSSFAVGENIVFPPSSFSSQLVATGGNTGGFLRVEIVNDDVGFVPPPGQPDPPFSSLVQLNLDSPGFGAAGGNAVTVSMDVRIQSDFQPADLDLALGSFFTVIPMQLGAFVDGNWHTIQFQGQGSDFSLGLTLSSAVSFDARDQLPGTTTVDFDNLKITTIPVPEPSAAMLSVLALFVLLGQRRR